MHGQSGSREPVSSSDWLDGQLAAGIAARRGLREIWKMLAPPAFGALRGPRCSERHLTKQAPQLECRRGTLLWRFREAGEDDLLERLGNGRSGNRRGRLR